MEGKRFAQLGAVVFTALAITAALMDSAHDRNAPAAAAGAVAAVRSAAPDPLAHELERCQLLGEAGAHDAACLATWAENRRRFLGAEPTLNNAKGN